MFKEGEKCRLINIYKVKGPLAGYVSKHPLNVLMQFTFGQRNEVEGSSQRAAQTKTLLSLKYFHCYSS